jgi:hypothetical protein
LESLTLQEIAIKLFRSSLFMYLVKVTVLGDLSTTNSHFGVLVHNVPPHVLHPPIALLASIALPPEPKIVKLVEHCPLELTQRELEEAVKVGKVERMQSGMPISVREDLTENGGRLRQETATWLST